jgi:hypothetical protein
MTNTMRAPIERHPGEWYFCVDSQLGKHMFPLLQDFAGVNIYSDHSILVYGDKSDMDRFMTFYLMFVDLV